MKLLEHLTYYSILRETVANYNLGHVDGASAHEGWTS